MKKFIFTMLLIVLLCCGCSFSKKRDALSLDEENQRTNQEAVIGNINQQCIEEQKGDAENLHPIDKAERDCIAKVDSTYDMNECSYKAMDMWFKEIDKYLSLLKTVTSEEDYAKLLKSQEDWENYKESEFVTVNIIMKKQGTMFQNVSVGKKTDIIKSRAIELKGLYDTLKYE